MQILNRQSKTQKLSAQFLSRFRLINLTLTVHCQYAFTVLTQLANGIAQWCIDINGLNRILISPVKIGIRAFAFHFDSQSTICTKILHLLYCLPTVLLR